MAQRLRSEAWRSLYAARKHIVEPVFGQIKYARGLQKFRLRGLRKVAAEWLLVWLTHNLLKIGRAPWRPSGLRATAEAEAKDEVK